MKESIELSTIIPASPETVYKAWIISGEHSGMTGSLAVCSSIIGAFFSAWDGYITGSNIKLIAFEQIVQSWRTTEFFETDEDSRLIIQLSQHQNGTILTLIHTNIPTGQTQYANGWKEHYFEPMKRYFSKQPI